MPAPRLIVFDFDGTLVDSLRDIGEAMNRVLATLSLPPRPIDDYRRIAGDGARMAVARATGLDPRADSARLDALTVEYLTIYRSGRSPHSVPYPGVTELLSALTFPSSRPVPVRVAPPALGVLTNKPHDIAVELVRRLFPEIQFASVEGLREGTKRKPDPTMLLRMMGVCGASPEETVYVGDTDTDMKTGRAAGAFTVGALWGFRDESELRAAGADAIVSRPTEILALIGSAPDRR